MLELKYMDEPTRQHWVPKVYLRQFATADTPNWDVPQINVYDTQTNKRFCTSIDNVAVKRHLYTIGVNESEKLYAVENVLSLIETKAKPYLAELSKGNNVQVIEGARLVLSIFLATLLVRNPRMHGLLHDYRDDLKKGTRFGRTSVTTKFGKKTYEWSKDEWKWFSEIDDEGMHIIFSRSVLWSAKPIANVLLKMKWCLIGASTGEFVTTDNPLSVYHPSKRSWGIATLGVHIHLAISPKYMLFIGTELPVAENKTYLLPAEGIDGFNSVIIWQAERYILSSSGFERIEPLIAECKKESNKTN